MFTIRSTLHQRDFLVLLDFEEGLSKIVPPLKEHFTEKRSWYRRFFCESTRTREVQFG